MSIIDVLKNDFRLIRRDMILMVLLIFVVYLGVVLRFLLPWANNYLAALGYLPGNTVTSSLAAYYPVILSMLVIFTGAILGGATFGFLILSEKDDDTLKAILVTPLSPKKYMNYRIIISMVVAFIIVLFVFYLVNIGILPLYKMILISLGASLTAPIIMLFLVMVSDGRVQGLSYSKFLSFGGFLTVISWWIKEPFQFLFGLFPPYWISKAYWVAGEKSSMWLFYLLIGILFQGMVILFLRNRLIKNVYKKL